MDIIVRKTIDLQENGDRIALPLPLAHLRIPCDVCPSSDRFELRRELYGVDPEALEHTIYFGSANLTVNRVRGLSIRVSARARAAAGPDAALLLDCADALVDAVDRARKSAAEVTGLNANGSEVAARAGNVQLCMHAVVVDEDRCSDDFDGVRPGPVKDDISRRFRQVKRFAMNAFSLFNHAVTAIP